MNIKDISTENEVILELSKSIVLEVVPEEEKAFDHFRKHFTNSNAEFEKWSQSDLKPEKAEIGFDLGSVVTFLTPWIILALKEAVPVARDVITETLKQRVVAKGTTNRELPLLRSEVNPAAVNKLEEVIILALKKKKIGGRARKRIAQTTLDTLLFDHKNAKLVRKLLSHE